MTEKELREENARGLEREREEERQASLREDEQADEAENARQWERERGEEE